MTAGPEDVAARPERRARRHVLTGLVVAGLLLLLGAWAASGPVGSAPDEEAHIIYAYGVATGQTLPGAERSEVVDRVPYTTVQIPTALLDYPDFHCYAFSPGQPVSCDPVPRTSTGIEAETYMTRYPPLYYAVVGTALRAGMWLGLPGSLTLLGVRILSGLMCAALVAVAARVLSRRFPALAVVTAVVVVATPVTMSLATAINPNGWEIAASVLMAAAVVAVRHDATTPAGVARATQWLLVVAAVLLVTARPLGVAWAGTLALLLLVPSRVEGRRVLPLRSLSWWTVGAGVAAFAAAVAWVLYAARFRGDANGVGDAWQSSGPLGRVVLIVLQLGDMLRTGASSFDWGEVVLPELAIFALVVTTAVVLTAQLVGARPGEPRAGLAAGFTATAALVVAVQSYADAFGWQGRYWLPVLAAAAVLLVPAMHGRALPPARMRRTVVTASAVLLTVGLGALTWSALRYAYGIGYVEGRFPPVPLVTQEQAWAPTGGLGVVLTAAAAGTVLLALAVGLVPPQGARSAPEVERPAPAEDVGTVAG
ncbi:DUF2142 domain-containing protein [Cellulomonas sp. B6]|uniref:DUF2142 domain-containing protein n=1 Tax=Cellulomonas sp. B6 TaxID=1295626 RepID=UPI00073C94FE|nr:DUF2142 domain-containing protein [Cellulomonas sp. B6]KSW29258.1 hypothetical protein ATM99_08885 [Cellulomonas sp. B6]